MTPDDQRARQKVRAESGFITQVVRKRALRSKHSNSQPAKKLSVSVGTNRFCVQPVLPVNRVRQGRDLPDGASFVTQASLGAWCSDRKLSVTSSVFPRTSP